MGTENFATLLRKHSGLGVLWNPDKLHDYVELPLSAITHRWRNNIPEILMYLSLRGFVRDLATQFSSYGPFIRVIYALPASVLVTAVLTPSNYLTGRWYISPLNCTILPFPPKSLRLTIVHVPQCALESNTILNIHIQYLVHTVSDVFSWLTVLRFTVPMLFLLACLH